MKNYFLLFTLTISLFTKAQQPRDAHTQEIVFKNVSVVPMNVETVLPNQTVVIKDGLIKAIGTKVNYDKNALIIDGKGKYLMPGLSEMHGHLPTEGSLQAMQDVLLLFAVKGITTVRSMLGSPVHLEVRSKVQSGEMLGPRLYISGPSFSSVSVKTPAEAIAKVKSQQQEGYDFLKMHPGLSRESFDAMAKTAKGVGINFGGHVSTHVGIMHAAESGYTTIDHLDGIVQGLIPRLDTLTESEAGTFGMFQGQHADMSRLANIINALKKNNVWIVPTQSLTEHWHSPNNSVKSLLNEPTMKFIDKKVLDSWADMKTRTLNDKYYDSVSVLKYIDVRKQIIHAFQQQGVNVLLGSDAPQVFSVPGFSAHKELRYYVGAGLTPYQALRTGTYNIGKFLKEPNLGIVQVGAIADLLLVDANPLKDISATEAISGVMLKGKWLDKKDIDIIMKKLEK